MFKKILVPLMLLTLCSHVSAALITHNGYTLDDTTSIVTDGTTEWLQWDLTIGSTINQALATYAADGWVLASNTQMSKLFNVFGFGVPAFDVREDGIQERNDKANELYIQFVELFGAVSTFIDQCAVITIPSCISGPIAGSSALYGSDNDNDGNFKAALVSIAGQSLSFDSTGRVIATASQSNLAQLLTDSYTADTATDILIQGGFFGGGKSGVALVRAQPIAPNDVPEPGIIVLLLIGIAGLGLTQRKKV